MNTKLLSEHKLNYAKNSDKQVEVIITRHAVDSFIKRYNAIQDVEIRKLNSSGITLTDFIKKQLKKLDYRSDESLLEVVEILKKYFSQSKKVDALNKDLKNRKSTYGNDTVYFVYKKFRFVVQSGILKTVEIADKDLIKLNNPKPKNGKRNGREGHRRTA